MRVRYTINESGELEARDGTILGRVVGITIESAPSPTTPPPTGEEEKTTTTPVVPTLLPSPAQEVWATYVEVMKPRRTQLDRESHRTIDAALKVASVPELQRAIVGCAASDWHMGRNPETRGKTYKQLSQIIKGKRGGRTTREQVDFFIEIADKAGITTAGVLSVDRAKLSRCKIAVMTAWQFPADDHAAAAGDEARTWLADHGIAVEMSGTGDELGKPSFRAMS